MTERTYIWSQVRAIQKASTTYPSRASKPTEIPHFSESMTPEEIAGKYFEITPIIYGTIGLVKATHDNFPECFSSRERADVRKLHELFAVASEIEESAMKSWMDCIVPSDFGG